MVCSPREGIEWVARRDHGRGRENCSRQREDHCIGDPTTGGFVVSTGSTTKRERVLPNFDPLSSWHGVGKERAWHDDGAERANRNKNVVPVRQGVWRPETGVPAVEHLLGLPRLEGRSDPRSRCSTAARTWKESVAERLWKVRCQ